VVPFAEDGAAIASNIQLRCRAHNGYEAERWFGPFVVREARPAYDPVSWVRTQSIERRAEPAWLTPDLAKGQ
jgi:hypothetical protein